VSGEGGKQPGFKRVNLSFEDKDWKMISRYLEQSEWRYLPKGTALRHILLQDVTARNSVLQGVTCPSPARASGEEKDLRKKEERGGKKNRAPDFTPIVASVIGRLNQHRPLVGKQREFNPEHCDDEIRACLRKGFTEEQLIMVADHKAAECKRKGDWSWFKPATLYRPTKFKAKLGEAEAGVRIEPQKSIPFTEGEKRKARHQERREATYESVTRKRDPNVKVPPI
jgi:uncharacterized phage protein (TIGR02220 family)